MFDPSGRLECDRSNHVPGCAHLGPLALRKLGGGMLAGHPDLGTATDPGFVPADPPPIPAEPDGLAVRIDVRVTRVGRRRCPRCRKLRVLFAQTAFSADQPVGYGAAMCAACAGFRTARP